MSSKYSIFSFFIIAFIIIWVSANLNWGDGRWNNIVRNDANGYYAYLPAILIYQDLSFNFIDEIVDDSLNSNINKGFINRQDGKVVNKYYIGTSIVLTPFFMLGHISNWILGLPLDGYSAYYRIFVQIGTIVYLLIGLILFVKILTLYKISDKIIAISMIAIVFGTNIFYYVVSEPLMSHIFSFAFVNLFVYSFLKFFKSFNSKSFLVGIFALAIITLIRPVNILIIFSMPFLSGSSKVFYKGLNYLVYNWKILFAGSVLFTIFILTQLIVYKIQTGNFLVYTYTNEGFDFLNPNLIKFMFSYRKGFFLYTPILFISVFGLFKLFKEKFKFISLILFLFLTIYVLSSWWMWYYGGSFAQRTIIEYYVFFFILLSLLLEKTKIRIIIQVLVFFLIIVCQIQTYQYQRGYLHWSDMNKERYWNNFLRIDKVINNAEKEWE